MLRRSSERCEAASSNTSISPDPRAFAVYIAASASRSIALALVQPSRAQHATYAGPDGDRLVGQHERPLQREQQTARHLGHVRKLRNVVEDGNELVPTEPREQVARR